MAKKPKANKYILPVTIGGAALLILAGAAGVFGKPTPTTGGGDTGGTNAPPSGTITITVE